MLELDFLKHCTLLLVEGLLGPEICLECVVGQGSAPDPAGELTSRAFSYSAPAAWNSLSPMLQQISNTDSFKRHLKTFLFQQAYLD